MLAARDHFFRGNSSRNGEVFDNPDDAAIAILSEIYYNKSKYERNREYGGRVCKSLRKNEYFYTNPTRGSESAVRPGLCPLLSIPYGNYHSHGIDEPGEHAGEWPSEGDFDLIKQYWGVKVGYVTLTTNEIVRYTPEHSRHYIDGNYGDILKKLR